MSDIPDYLYEFFFSEDGQFLREDTKSWSAWRGTNVSEEDADGLRHALEFQFRKFSEFRSLVDYRLRKSPRHLDAPRPTPIWPRATDLHIFADSIGPRLRIQHGHSTWIMGTLGSDCLVRHNVTIGLHPSRGAPTLGNRVEVGTGAVIFGRVLVGNDVQIGPNAVVDQDIPANSFVFSPRPVVKSKQ
jgi:serine O-acetyltransferase